jgi:phospholipid/cholesterol/gamma-HCH transport system substrate-binding protein
MVRGFKVGMVTKIYLNPENVDELIVEIEVDGEIRLPRDTRAIIYSMGIVGGRGIILQYDKLCDDDCILPGEFIEGEVRGLLPSMIPENDLERYLALLQNGIGGVFDSIGLSGAQDSGDNTGMQLKMIVANLAAITGKLDRVIEKSDASISQSIRNIQSFTGSLKENEAHLNNVMANLDLLTSQVSGAGLDKTILKVDTTLADLAVSVSDLKSVVKSADQSFRNIDSIVARVEAGEGSLGKLISKDSIYQDLTLTIEHINLLLQDIRLNPKRYLNVSVIGRKNNTYEKPENDPAFE